MGQITIVGEDIDSLYDTYNALVSMKINSIITVLTIFTAIL
jgi:Mg2+ and Co2+ transporter CorA